MDRHELQALFDDSDDWIPDDDPWAPWCKPENDPQHERCIDPWTDVWSEPWDEKERGPWIEYVTTDQPVRRTSLMRWWSQDRLQRLFDSFAARLWPGQLTGWRVEPRHFIEAVELYGCCEHHEKRISMDLASHRSNGQVRGTLLHEMCHAVTPDSAGHDLYFFREVERLLALGLRPFIDFALYLDEPDAETVRATLPQCSALRRRGEARVHRLRAESEYRRRGLRGVLATSICRSNG